MSVQMIAVTLVIIVAVALGILGAVATARQQAANRLRLLQYASSLGMTFTPRPPGISMSFLGLFDDASPTFINALSDLEPFRNYPNGQVSNILQGTVGGLRWTIFDYRYTVSTGKSSSTYEYQIFCVEIAMYAPPFSLRSEFWGSQVLLGGDIEVESEPFNRKYHVDCENREFAYGLLNPQMVDWLTQAPLKLWQLSGNRLMIMESGRITPENIADHTGLMFEFLNRIPKYLREDYGGKEWKY